MWLLFVLMTLVAGAVVALRIIGRQEPRVRQAASAQSTPQMTEQELNDIAWDLQTANRSGTGWDSYEISASTSHVTR
jgi:hypothetical protein